MQLDFSTLSPTQVYHTVIQTLIPRPVAWVLSENEGGSFNIAPFSYFTAVSSEPPILMFSVGKKPSDQKRKDTARNIIETKKAVIHIADQNLVEALNESAAPLAFGESEVNHLNLDTTTFDNFSLPRITAAPVAYACELYEVKEVGDVPMSLIFMEIKHAYITDEAIGEGERLVVDANKIDPVARLGGNNYAAINESFTLVRPTE